MRKLNQLQGAAYFFFILHKDCQLTVERRYIARLPLYLHFRSYSGAQKKEREKVETKPWTEGGRDGKRQKAVQDVVDQKLFYLIGQRG